MSTRWRTGAVTGALVILVSGCGSSDAAAPPPDGPGPSAPAATEASAAPRSGGAPAAGG
ncbi:hypothetical protein O7623_11095 [Solwaraspora sp. WMMD791]|uniref:hypothetical protein n=1 Tax=Solwaraspora sp. WMMD791 TaxID=3016086 RepID=UPI00249CEDC4|nr:hypothetical protein [Solwaraspora sp. WMMD791]WFE29690.1 hypothetical protein O7623_11095 [Solwaraspora sp. WMMD791]